MNILRRALSGALEILKRKANLPSEQKKLFDDNYDAPGYHIHDENNPLGLHRHRGEDSMNGEHTHTPENPEGVHTHGDLSGQLFIDGKHRHNNDCGLLGSHKHKKENQEVVINIHKPGSTI